MFILIGDKLKSLNINGLKIHSFNSEKIPLFKTIEECEKWFIVNDPYFFSSKDEIYNVVVYGGDPLCGSVLFLAEKFKDKKINIIYLFQNKYSNNLTELNHKITVNILQEYARSGCFESIYLIDLDVIIKLYSNYPINKFSVIYDQIIVDLLKFIEWASSNPSCIYGESYDILEINKIRTISFVFFDKKESIPLFNLEKSSLSEDKFYFLFTQKELDDKNDVITIAEENMKNISNKKYFGIYLGDNVRSYHFCVGCSNLIQKF